MSRLLPPSVKLYRVPREATRRVMVVIMSRGMAVPEPVADASERSMEYGAGFALIERYPAVEAKNRAAGLAMELGASLLLVEDDVLADAGTWNRALAPSTQQLPVRFATAKCRNGDDNTRWHADGTPMYSGTPFILIPHPVMLRLALPLFVANEYCIADGELALRGPSAKGHHSDVHLWATLRALDPRPKVELVGHVTCLKHRLNRDTHDLMTPETVEAI